MRQLFTFVNTSVDSIINCTECGECINRCPYEIPIHEVLKRNYALYRMDLEENPD